MSIAETFGVTDPGRRLREVDLALRGDPHTPASRWGLSSIGIFRPILSVRTWLGERPSDRLLPISNLFNRTPTPPSEGWSVRKTQVRDFRGGRLTYDSHNGTDFAIPVGTEVVAPAPGVVWRISDEFHRGGLKVLIDHGHGVITTSNHLGRVLVRVGDVVERGRIVALSAYSGIDAVVSFPWSVPHVHFNTWLNGVPVDPFATDDEESLWRRRNDPSPCDGTEQRAEFEPTEWDEDALAAVIAGCVDPQLQRQLAQTTDPHQRAIDTVFMKNYFPTRFTVDAPLYARQFERTPLLDLPFRARDYDGIRFCDRRH